MNTHAGFCPVCGCALDSTPWKEDSAPYEICPCCYIHFGYDDDTEAGAPGRIIVYEKWRRDWIQAGMKWHSKSRRPPVTWNPVDQWRAIGVHLDR